MKTATSALHHIFWQNPFVDIFKNWPLSEKLNCDKQGEIFEIQDKEIGKKVYKISGSVSASNFICIPSKKNGGKPLGLVGKYIYVSFMVPAGSLFSFHFEYMAMGKSLKISFSNLYKTMKIITDTTIQIPLKDNFSKWTILCINIKELIEKLLCMTKVIKNGNADNFEIQMNSVQLNAKMFARSVYTSDNLYTVKTLPKEMQFRINKNEEWEKLYYYYMIDSFVNMDSKSDSNVSQNEKETQEISKIVLKKVETSNKENQSVAATNVKISISETKTQSTVKPSTIKGIVQPKAKSIISKVEENPSKNDQTPTQKEGNTDVIQVSNSPIMPEPETKILKVKKANFTLEPNPIVVLSHVQGYQPQRNNLFFVEDDKILYSCGNISSLMELKTKYQRFYLGQQRSIKCIACSKQENLMVSAEDAEENCKIYIWSIYPQRLETNFNSGLSNIGCMDIAIKYENRRKFIYLIFTGKDNLNRNIICIYDLSDFSYKQPYLFAKQISDWDIQIIKFYNRRDPTNFISCGKESIRFWKLKHKVIIGNSLVLNEHGRGTIFTDFIAFDYLGFDFDEPIIEVSDEEDNSEIQKPKGKKNSNNDKKANVPKKEKDYKGIFSSDKGNIYLVDINKQELLGIYKLHDSPIKCINISPTNSYIVTTGEDRYIRLWNMDVTQMLIEIKLDSQINNLLVNDKDQIICGCINGTIGELDLKNKKIDYIVRSHSDRIISFDYHKLTKHLITISRDFSIKIWEVKLGYIHQLYEFKCLDEQVSTVTCFHTKSKFICGFESGSLRVFDLLKCQIEMEPEKGNRAIVSVAISSDDNHIISVDIEGLVYIYNEQLELIKKIQNDFKYSQTNISFDYKSQNVLIQHNSNTVRIYSTGTWTIRSVITIEEEIKKSIFSNNFGEIFLLTNKSKLLKYKVLGDYIKIEREYWALHNANVLDFAISANCKFIFTLGEDQLLKIWDYAMRGKMLPAFQAFSAGVILNKVIPTNDEKNLLFTSSKENNAIFFWEFKADLVAEYHEIESRNESEEDTEENENEAVDNELPLNTKDQFIVQNNGPKNLEVKSIYQEEEKLLGIPESSVKFTIAPQQKKLLNGKGSVTFKESLNIEEETNYAVNFNNFPELQIYANRSDTIQEQPVVNEEYEKSLFQGRLNSGYGQVETKDQLEFIDNKDLLLENNDDLPEMHENYKYPGHYMHLKSVIGYNAFEERQNLIWNYDLNYIGCPVGSSIIITFLEEPKKQKILSGEHSDDVGLLHLSKRNRYIVSATVSCKIESSCSITLWDAEKLTFLFTVTDNGLLKIHSIDISPCQNYLLCLGEGSNLKYTLVNIWEIQTKTLVATTIFNLPYKKIAKWNEYLKGSLEFTIINSEKILFWRLGPRKNLEYQEAVYSTRDLQGHKFNSLDFYPMKSRADSSYMFIGTTLGSLLIFDTRSNTLLCAINSLINGPINQIFVSVNRMILTSDNANVYSWKLPSSSNENMNEMNYNNDENYLQSIVQILQETPEILLVDSKPYSGIFLDYHHGAEGLIGTKGGVIWYVNWEERATLRLITSHVFQNQIYSCKIKFKPNSNTEIVLLSASGDGTVRMWDSNTLEQISEYFVPRKEVLCIDISIASTKCICGYSDGIVRFYDYEKLRNIGTVSLYTIEKSEPSRKINDVIGHISELPGNKKDKYYPIAAVKFLKNENNILVGNLNGEIYMIYVINWENFTVEFRNLIGNAGYAINSIDIHEGEPWNTWLLTTKNRKIMVWNRKDLSLGQKDLDYYINSLQKINNLEYYLIDNWKVMSKDKDDKLEDLNNLTMQGASKYEFGGDTIARFWGSKPDFYVSFTVKIGEIFIRDFREHIIIKSFKINNFPRSIIIREKEQQILIGTDRGNIKFLDYENGLERDTVEITTAPITSMDILLPPSQSRMDYDNDNNEQMMVMASKNNIYICTLPK